MTAKHNSNEHVLLVCHGDFGKMVYAAYYDEDWKSVLMDFHFGNSEVLVLSDRLKRPRECDSNGHCSDVAGGVDSENMSERRLFTTQQYNS
jgi:broad specificity phosphatase PhoE